MADDVKKFDLDVLNVSDNRHSDGREIFDPDGKSAWAGASSRVYVATGSLGANGGVYQVGYDPESDTSWVRTLPSPDSRWTAWVALDMSVATAKRTKVSKADEAEDDEPEKPAPKKK